MIDTKRDAVLAGSVVMSPGPIQERFVGQLSTSAILSTIGPKLPALGIFAQWLQARPIGYNSADAEIHELLDGWRNAFGDSLGTHVKEEKDKIDLTAEVLRRWFGEAMLQQPVHIADLQRASVVDLLRLLDYPNDYVPVLLDTHLLSLASQ